MEANLLILRLFAITAQLGLQKVRHGRVERPKLAVQLEPRRPWREEAHFYSDAQPTPKSYRHRTEAQAQSKDPPSSFVERRKSRAQRERSQWLSRKSNIHSLTPNNLTVCYNKTPTVLRRTEVQGHGNMSKFQLDKQNHSGV